MFSQDLSCFVWIVGLMALSHSSVKEGKGLYKSITIDLSLNCDKYELIGSPVDDNHRRTLAEQRLTARSDRRQ